jgi:hypothetical protein
LFKRFTLIVVIWVGTMHAHAQNQEECELVLNQATEEFNAGHFYGIPALLNDCLNKNLKPAWRQRAFILLAETYLLLDDPFGAERSYLEILRANPEFVTDPSRDPIDLVYLGSQFTATPIFSLYGHLGTNVSPVHLIVERSAFSGSNSGQYNLRAGVNLGAGAECHYDENFSASLEANYFLTSYEYKQSGIFGRDNISVTDRQSWLKFPLTIRFSDALGKYRPYGYVGYSLDLLLSDRATITYSDLNFSDGKVVPDMRESPILEFKPKRNTLNQAFLFGGGLKYKLGLEYAFIDVRYSIGLTNLVKVENTIEKGNLEDPVFTWGYVDNLFRMNNLSISVGYIYPLYKPRKLKKGKSKSVLRKIKRQSNESTQD